MPRQLTKVQIEQFFATMQKHDPEPTGELDYVNAYTLLVAVVLSAQATDVGVNKATKELFRLADTPEKMVALGEGRVRMLRRGVHGQRLPGPRQHEPSESSQSSVGT